jgi:RES domain-containing protein
MIVYRLSKSKFASDLSGRGAEKTGGRWNSKGTALVYTSASRALCTTEIAVHTPLGNLAKDYMLVTIEIPESTPILDFSTIELPRDWKSIPHAHSTQLGGDNFVAQGLFAVLKVPSVVVQDEFNYLINPLHPAAREVVIRGIEPFNFDERLFNR